MSESEDLYKKAVLTALEHGPKARHELVKELTPSNDITSAKMSIKKLQKTLNELEDEKRIICHPVRIGASRKWTSLYALPQDEILVKTRMERVSATSYRRSGRKPTTLEGKVKRTIENLRFILKRNPTSLEISYDTGETPEAIREVAFKLSPTMGWREPSEKQISRANEKVKEIYKIARLLGHFPSEIVQKRSVYCLHDESWNSILDRVNYARKQELNELPKIVATKKDKKRIEFEYRWPKGSKWYGSGDYPEYYDKENRRLVSWRLRFAEKTKEQIDQLLKEIKNSRKS